jgi:hypothetical protein
MDAAAVAGIDGSAQPRERGCENAQKEVPVTRVSMEDIRKGWKVFAGPDPIGEVSYVTTREVGVKRGRLIRHEYVIPIEYVGDAADGVVDLTVGRDAVAGLQPVR